MIYKLERIGKAKEKQCFRVYMHEIISSIENYEYIDNPLVINKFTKADLRGNPRHSTLGVRKKRAKGKDDPLLAAQAVRQSERTVKKRAKNLEPVADVGMSAEDQVRLLDLLHRLTGIDIAAIGQQEEPTNVQAPAQPEWRYMPRASSN